MWFNRHQHRTPREHLYQNLFFFNLFLFCPLKGHQWMMRRWREKTVCSTLQPLLKQPIIAFWHNSWCLRGHYDWLGPSHTFILYWQSYREQCLRSKLLMDPHYVLCCLFCYGSMIYLPCPSSLVIHGWWILHKDQSVESGVAIVLYD